MLVAMLLVGSLEEAVMAADEACDEKYYFLYVLTCGCMCVGMPPSSMTNAVVGGRQQMPAGCQQLLQLVFKKSVGEAGSVEHQPLLIIPGALLASRVIYVQINRRRVVYLVGSSDVAGGWG